MKVAVQHRRYDWGRRIVQVVQAVDTCACVPGPSARSLRWSGAGANQACRSYAAIACATEQAVCVQHMRPLQGRRDVRCFATKAPKTRREHCCSNCGYSTVQYFGVCPSCAEFGTCAPPVPRCALHPMLVVSRITCGDWKHTTCGPEMYLTGMSMCTRLPYMTDCSGVRSIAVHFRRIRKSTMVRFDAQTLEISDTFACTHARRRALTWICHSKDALRTDARRWRFKAALRPALAGAAAATTGTVTQLRARRCWIKAGCSPVIRCPRCRKSERRSRSKCTQCSSPVRIQHTSLIRLAAARALCAQRQAPGKESSTMHNKMH